MSHRVMVVELHNLNDATHAFFLTLTSRQSICAVWLVKNIQEILILITSFAMCGLA